MSDTETLEWINTEIEVPGSDLLYSVKCICAYLRQAMQGASAVSATTRQIREAVGCSVNTVHRALSELEAMDVIRTQHFMLVTRKGRHKQILITPGSQWDTPETWARPGGPRNWGGSRPGAGRPRSR